MAVPLVGQAVYLPEKKRLNAASEGTAGADRGGVTDIGCPGGGQEMHAMGRAQHQGSPGFVPNDSFFPISDGIFEERWDKEMVIF